MPVRFPILNPYQFSLVGKTQPARFLTRYANTGWLYKETLQNYEKQRDDYKHIARFDDVICVQFDTDFPSGAVLSIYKGTANGVGVQIGSFGIGDATQATVSGNTVDGEAVTTVQFTFILNQLAGYDGAEDLYYFVVLNGTGTQTEHLSEPIYFRAQHLNSVLIEYGNSINDFDTIFQQLSPRFQKRMFGAVHSWQGGSEDVVYNNQGEEPVLLDSIPYDVYMFTAAGDIGIPVYEQQKLNHIFSCDRVAIDNKLFVKDDGASFEYQNERNYPLSGMSIKIRAGENVHSLTTNIQRTTVFSGTPPFAAYNVLLFNGLNYVPIIPVDESVIVDDDTAGAALVVAWNLTTAGMGLGGTFGYTTGGTVYYDNADGENWFQSDAIVQEGIINLTWTTAAATRTATFSYLGGWVTVDNGDSSNALIPDTNGVFTTVAHQYALADTYVQRLFFNTDYLSGFSKLTIQQPPTNVNLDNITGIAPIEFSHLHVFDTTLDSSFNLTFLAPCRAFIQSIVLLDAGLVNSFVGTFFNGGGVNIMPNLVFIDLRANALLQAAVNAFLNDYIAYTQWAGHICYVRLEGGTNGAPSGSGATAKIIINNHWSVLVPSGVITSN